jgi:glycosyltransferase involved in cell wall biosynthesis
MEEAELLRNLNKVFIADALVDQVDGLLLIGYEGKNTQVLPYFPQLLLDEQTKEKPLTIAAEGVCFESCQIDGSDTPTTLNALTSHGGKFHMDSSLVSRPVILNVGRLHPLKGQHNLVKAWTESSLNQFYNLVLIGGNLAEPNGVELSVIRQIDETMRRNPDLTGRFSHVPALPNQEVRFLEQAIVSRNRDEFPNVYLSSSYKEEFGISILEAMTAGFLVLAPTRGGVSDYIEHGVNGFLVSTDDAESIRASMEAVLHAPEKTASLHEIALRGERLAQEKLSITRIGKDYLEHYLQLTPQP